MNFFDLSTKPPSALFLVATTLLVFISYFAGKWSTRRQLLVAIEKLEELAQGNYSQIKELAVTSGTKDGEKFFMAINSVLKSFALFNKTTTALANIFQNAPVAIVELDKTGKLVCINNEAKKILNWSENINQSKFDFSPLLKTATKKKREVLLTVNGHSLPFSCSNVQCTDGQMIVCLDSLSEIYGLVGKIQKNAVTSRDILKLVSAMAQTLDDNCKKLFAQNSKILQSTDQVRNDSSNFGDKTKEASSDLSLVSTNTDEVAGSISTIATAIEELSATINNLSKQTVQVAGISKEATVKVQTSFEIMNELAANSKQISKIKNIIEDIADQTNLLSLNATIEAASANEAGAGFAVVASEIKNLANQTINSTNVISEQIGKIQSTVKIAFEETARIQEIIAQVGEFTNTLATSIEEQSFAIKDISKTMQTASTSTKNIATKSASSSKLISSMTSFGPDINERLKLIFELMTDVEMVGENIVKSGGLIANRISSLQDEIGEMEIAIDKFELTNRLSQ